MTTGFEDVPEVILQTFMFGVLIPPSGNTVPLVIIPPSLVRNKYNPSGELIAKTPYLHHLLAQKLSEWKRHLNNYPIHLELTSR